MQLIEIRDVTKRYNNGVTALCDINLNISKGEFVFVIGASGSGKSTLIKLLYRQEKPTRGEVYVGGINVAKLRNGRVYKLRRKLGIVFQDYKLLPKKTVFENIAFALEVVSEKSAIIRKRVREVLKDKKMTQYKLGQQTGLYHSTLTDILNCKYQTPNFKNMALIIRELGMSMQEFFDSKLFDFSNLEID